MDGGNSEPNAFSRLPPPPARWTIPIAHCLQSAAARQGVGRSTALLLRIARKGGVARPHLKRPNSWGVRFGHGVEVVIEGMACSSLS